MNIFARLEKTKLYLYLRERMNYNLVSFLRKHALQNVPEAKIAEIACGSGYAAHLMAGFPNIVLSIAADISLEYIQRTPIQGMQSQFILSDIYKPATQPASLDLVWNSSSIEELEDSLGALAMMGTMVKQNGYVYVGVPFKYGPMFFLKMIPNNSVQEWLGKTFDHHELINMFEKSGLKIERSRIYMGGIFLGMLGRKL